MPRPTVLIALMAIGIVSLAACQTDGAPRPGGPHPPSTPPPTAGRMCGGIAAIRCDTGQYCKVEGPMFPDKSGVCTVQPRFCAKIYKPVCGMNGANYANACEAAAAGASVEHEGACSG